MATYTDRQMHRGNDTQMKGYTEIGTHRDLDFLTTAVVKMYGNLTKYFGRRWGKQTGQGFKY